MPVDFPPSPTLNLPYTFNGRTWTYNGTGWQLVGNSTSSLTLTDGLIVPAANATAPSVRFTGSTSTGLYSPGTDQVALATAGTGRLFVDSTGRVGIGTSSPSSFLHVSQPTNANLTLTNTTVGLSNTVGTNGSGDLDLNANGSQQLTLKIAGVERARIDSSGRLLVGTSSAANTGLVNIAGDISLYTGNTIAGRQATYALGVSDNGTTGQKARIAFAGTGTNGFLTNIVFSNFNGDFFNSGLVERARIDSSGRLLVGTSTALASAFGTLSPRLQVAATTSGPVSFFSYANDTFAARLDLSKSRGATVGTNTILVDGDGVGEIYFNGADGTNFIPAALIRVNVDGTPGLNSMPGRVVFSTTASGASSVTEQLRITNGGTVVYNQPAPAAVDTTATLTVANLTAKIITSSTAAAVTMTLPTGTLMDGGFSGLYTNMAFEWSVINTGGTNAVTIAAGTSHTIVGSATVAANNSGKFLSRRTAATTWVTYRLSS